MPRQTMGSSNSFKRYVYVWADGIHLQVHLEDNAQCILVVIGATPEGN
jgi:putative transposase